VGVPIYALFIDFLNTPFGEAFFANPIVNQHLKNVFDAYNNMLMSRVSLKYLNEEPEGWFSPEAVYNPKTRKGFWKPEDYVLDRSNKPNWGFSSWNDWFIRKVTAQSRPLAQGKNVIVNSSDSFPLAYPKGSPLTNPTIETASQQKFWMKDTLYSLYDMFSVKKAGVKEIVDKYFVGGTIYQAFLDPWCYHRWHSPVTGTIVKSYKLDGSYYLDKPGVYRDSDNSYIESQPMLSIVSVRQIYIIKLKDSDLHVAVIEIGMAEVSSCNTTVIEGQEVNAGEQLGYFQFGGSSHCVIFDKRMDVTFKEGMFDMDADGNTQKQLVNSFLCNYKVKEVKNN